MSAKKAKRIRHTIKKHNVLVVREFLTHTAAWPLRQRIRLAWHVIVKKYKIKKGGEKNVHSTKAKR